LKLKAAKKAPGDRSRNKPKPLSGIETARLDESRIKGNAAINLNPYQGLKRGRRGQSRTLYFGPQ